MVTRLFAFKNRLATMTHYWLALVQRQPRHPPLLSWKIPGFCSDDRIAPIQRGALLQKPRCLICRKAHPTWTNGNLQGPGIVNSRRLFRQHWVEAEQSFSRRSDRTADRKVLLLSAERSEPAALSAASECFVTAFVFHDLLNEFPVLSPTHIVVLINDNPPHSFRP